MRKLFASDPRGKLFVLEHNPRGHRAIYLRLIVEECLRRKKHVVLAITSSVAESSTVRPLLEHDDVELARVPDESTVSDAIRLLDIGVSDILLIPDGDAYISQIARSCFQRSAPTIRFVVMQDPVWTLNDVSAHSVRELVRAVAKLAILIALNTLAPSADVRTLTYPRAEDLGANDTKKNQVEDPVIAFDSPPLIEGFPELDSDRTWVGLVGGISIHKNPVMLCEAVTLLNPALLARLGVAMLGPVSEEVLRQIPDLKARLSRVGVPLIIDDRPRSNDEMNGDIERLDLVALLYSTSAPNSTAAKAAFYGKPILAAGHRQFREFVRLISGQDAVVLSASAVARRLTFILHGEALPTRKSFGDPSVYARKLLSR